ncbi:hypothetical protein [Roseobacter weihaiensis]|uniref:hypothetical protein n=1 Tax=Roseobacter weihaiensis TaxID=2763262 RepID=UPI001D0B92D3|nr:hypothetical protein [Roseobacter sp. H9]
MKRAYTGPDYMPQYKADALAAGEQKRRMIAIAQARKGEAEAKKPPPPTKEERMYPKMKQAMTRDKVSREKSFRETTGPRQVKDMSSAERWEALRQQGWRVATDQDERNLKSYPSMANHIVSSVAHDGTPIVRPSTEAERHSDQVIEELSPNG